MGLGLTIKSIVRSLFDERTPKKQKITALLASLYAISPIDLVPETAAFIGLADDGLIVTIIMVLLRYSLPKQVYEDHQQRYKEDPGIGIGKILIGFLIIWVSLLAILAWAIFGS